MRGLRAGFCDWCCALLLWVASWIVPAAVRGEWLREWRSELWYARREHRGAEGLRADLSQMKFCLGALQDAHALGGRLGARNAGGHTVRGSARECALMLLACVAISLGCGLLLPHVRAKLWPSCTGDAQSLMLIEDTRAAERGEAMLSGQQYMTWATRRQRVFQSFAFYEIRPEVVSGSIGRERVRLAYATANVFDVVRSGVRELPLPADRRMRSVVVSPELWRAVAEDSSGGSALVIRMGAQEFAVSGVAAPAVSSLPGRPNAWVLEQGSGSLGNAKGFLLGRVNPGFYEAARGDRWAMRAPEPDGFASDFTCVSLGQALRQPWQVCLFAVMVALLALPATTSLPLGDYPSRTHSRGAAIRVRRWCFLLGKMGLVLLAVYCTSMDVAFADPRLTAHGAEYIQLLSAFSLCLWGMRWTLRDQRQRCPVCLSKLTHPARVGQPSWSFLAWNGTELICAGGHGLMHVPEMETSWFSTQRWLALDGSWQVLFVPSHAGVGAP